MSIPLPRPVPEKLSGDARRRWERSILDKPGLKRSRLHLVRILLDEFCRGKCWCYPGNELLARKAGVSTATIQRCLRDLVKFAVIRIEHVRGRRRIVFPSHTHAPAYLASIGADGPVDQSDQGADHFDQAVDHFDQRILEKKLGKETTTKTSVVVVPSPLIVDKSMDGTPGCPSTPATSDPGPAWDDAIKALSSLTTEPAGEAEVIRRVVPKATPQAVQAACVDFEAKLANPRFKLTHDRLGYLIGIVRNKVLSGRPVPVVPAPRPTASVYTAEQAHREAMADVDPLEPRISWRKLAAQDRSGP